MADITITAANVVAGASAQYYDTTAGATITAGQTVYIDASDSNKAKLADANASSTTATVKGVALNGASSGQPVKIQTSGSLTIGATITSGGVYVQSATAGGIAPVADLTTGWRTSIIGIGTSTSVLKLFVNNSDTAV
jgi:hypothetical protein